MLLTYYIYKVAGSQRLFQSLLSNLLFLKGWKKKNRNRGINQKKNTYFEVRQSGRRMNQ